MIKSPDSINAYCDDALGELDAVGVAERIRSKEISAEEAVEAAISRAQTVNSKLNAISTEMFSYARQQAKMPYQGEFSGVPTFIKDNDDVEGFPTTHGSRPAILR